MELPVFATAFFTGFGALVLGMWALTNKEEQP
jgi:hypothetical protein